MCMFDLMAGENFRENYNSLLCMKPSNMYITLKGCCYKLDVIYFT